MNVIKCKNGHFFDGDAYSTCPHCGESAMGAMASAPVKEEKKSFWNRGRKENSVQPASHIPYVAPHENVVSGNTPTDVMEESRPEPEVASTIKKNVTLDFWQTSSHSPTGSNKAPEVVEEKPVTPIVQAEEIERKIPVQVEEKPAEEKPNEAEPSLQEVVKKASASNEGKTMSYFSMANSTSSTPAKAKQPAEPVVGWLVCVGGCHFGECFNIYAGKNSIGRSEENRIVIPEDNSVSRVKHALIVYEPKKRNFFLQPGDSSGLTYLNEDYITDSHKLTTHDVIELGDCKFVFVPLCGEAFSWENHMSKGE